MFFFFFDKVCPLHAKIYDLKCSLESQNVGITTICFLNCNDLFGNHLAKL